MDLQINVETEEVTKLFIGTLCGHIEDRLKLSVRESCSCNNYIETFKNKNDRPCEACLVWINFSQGFAT